jgi:hypothetical protein
MEKGVNLSQAMSVAKVPAEFGRLLDEALKKAREGRVKTICVNNPVK